MGLSQYVINTLVYKCDVLQQPQPLDMAVIYWYDRFSILDGSKIQNISIYHHSYVLNGRKRV